MFVWDAAKDPQLRQMWLDGLTVREIGAQLGISPATVCGHSQRLGLPRRAHQVTSSDRSTFTSLYERGLTIVAVARRTGFHRDTVRRALLESGVELDGPYRKWEVRHDAFSEPPTPEAWYWIGMLAADGCVRGPSICLVQKNSCEAVLRRFMSFLGCPERPLGVTNKGRARVADVSSPQLAADLAVHGVVPRKTYSLRVSPAASLQPNFWLGVFDGDGCISFTWRGAPLITMLGTEALMNAFAAFVERNTKGGRPRVALHAPDRQTLWQVRLGGDRARQLAELWLSVSEVSLEAKRARLERAVRYESRATRARLAVRRRRCDFCGAWVERPPSRLLEHVFCSPDHYWKWRTTRKRRQVPKPERLHPAN